MNSTPPPAYVITFTASQQSAWLVAPQLAMPAGSKGLDVVIISPHKLRKGPVEYEGGYKQQRLAATAYPFQTSRDFYAAGLALHAGGGSGCAVRNGFDVCHTLVPAGFLQLHAHHWQKLKVTLFKPAPQPVSIRIRFRPA